MFEHIILEPEQEQLLIDLVEAHRSVPTQKRTKFLPHHVVGGDARAVVYHPGLPRDYRAHDADFESLARTGLLQQGFMARGPAFAISPLGFRYYEDLRMRQGHPIDNVENTMQAYVSADAFKKAFPEAFAKWSQAEQLLWTSDSVSQLTTIGHLCREALQAFSQALVTTYKPPSFDPDKAHTVARLKSVIECRRTTLGPTVAEVLDAVVVFWGTVSDLVQRQEHDSQKEGRPLTWQDARRVVLLTLLVMSEVERSVTSENAA